jgi:hypothetical protein
MLLRQDPRSLSSHVKSNRLHKTSMMTRTKEMIILGLVTATMGQAKSSAFWDGDHKVSLGADALTCSFDWKKARDRRFYSTLFTRAVMFCLVILVMVLWLRQASAAPVAVRFVEGVTHGFLVLRNVNGGLLASGDLLQVQRGDRSRVAWYSAWVFRFQDGSLYDETVVFTQERVFTMQSYRLVQRGPALPRTPKSRWSEPRESTA